MFFNNLNAKYFSNCFKNNLYMDFILKRFIQKTLSYIFLNLAVFLFEKYFVEQIIRFSFFKKFNNTFYFKNDIITIIITITFNVTLLIVLLACELI